MFLFPLTYHIETQESRGNQEVILLVRYCRVPERWSLHRSDMTSPAQGTHLVGWVLKIQPHFKSPLFLMKIGHFHANHISVEVGRDTEPDLGSPE